MYSIGAGRARPTLKHRRCSCVRCGAHVTGVQGRATLGGRCSTCGSYELVPVIGADGKDARFAR
jgi:hypothetical protein